MSTDKLTLSKEWIDLFTKLSDNPTTVERQFHIEVLGPVFVWRDSKALTVKTCGPLSQRFGKEVRANVKQIQSQYQFEFNEFNWKNLLRLVSELHNMESNLWDEKYKKYLSSKRPPSDIYPQPKKLKSNKNSLLIRINGTKGMELTDFIEESLYDGQGLCLNNGDICVLDNGKGIRVYNDQLKLISNFTAPTLQKKSGIGLAFDNVYYYVLISETLLIIRKDPSCVFQSRNKMDFEDIITPVSVRVHEGNTYVLGSNYLIISMPFFEKRTNMFLFKVDKDVSFSDFVYVENSAFILDSKNGDIYKFSFGKLEKLRLIGMENIPGNPRGICTYTKNSFLVAQPNNQLITQFMLTPNEDSLTKCEEFSTKDYCPDKIISKNNFIFATTFKDMPTKNQPEAVSSMVSVDNDDLLNSLIGILDKIIEIMASQVNQNSSTFHNVPTNQTSFTFHNEQAEMLKYYLSTNILTLHLLHHSSRVHDNQILHKLSEGLLGFIENLSLNQIHFIKKMQIFDTLIFLINYKYICHNSNSNSNYSAHLISKESDSRSNNIGSIVYIDEDLKYSFSKVKKPIAFGVMYQNLISILGSTLVQVFLPKKYQSIDKRGMFVILTSNSEGVGKIISFEDLIARNADSYHLVGVCNLEKSFSNSNVPENILLYSDHLGIERISFPIGYKRQDTICFVSITLLSMSDLLLDIFISELVNNSSQEHISRLGLVVPQPLLHL